MTVTDQEHQGRHRLPALPGGHGVSSLPGRADSDLLLGVLRQFPRGKYFLTWVFSGKPLLRKTCNLLRTYFFFLLGLCLHSLHLSSRTLGL